MCVIIKCLKGKPTLKTLEACELSNTAGGGIAWFEGGKVCWLKGVKAAEIAAKLEAVKLPCVIHFRLATVGGISNELCHPFPITPKSELYTSGRVDESAGVLFHNGHIREWDILLLAAGIFWTEGPISDSRAIALIASQRHTLRLLTKLPGFWAIMKQGRIISFSSQKWDVEDDGCEYSNLNWKWRLSNSGFSAGASFFGGGEGYWRNHSFFHDSANNGKDYTGADWEGSGYESVERSHTEIVLEHPATNPKPDFFALLRRRVKRPKHHDKKCNCRGCQAWREANNIVAKKPLAVNHAASCPCLECREKRRNVARQPAEHHMPNCVCIECERARAIRELNEINQGLTRRTQPALAIGQQSEDDKMRETVALKCSIHTSHQINCACTACVEVRNFFWREYKAGKTILADNPTLSKVIPITFENDNKT